MFSIASFIILAFLVISSILVPSSIILILFSVPLGLIKTLPLSFNSSSILVIKLFKFCSIQNFSVWTINYYQHKIYNKNEYFICNLYILLNYPITYTNL